VGAGAVWTAETPDPDFIFQGNDDAIDYGKPDQFNPAGARMGDDGRLNFGEAGQLATGDLIRAFVGNPAMVEQALGAPMCQEYIAGLTG
jgi:hypothetical protein